MRSIDCPIDCPPENIRTREQESGGASKVE